MPNDIRPRREPSGTSRLRPRSGQAPADPESPATPAADEAPPTANGNGSDRDQDVAAPRYRPSSPAASRGERATGWDRRPASGSPPGADRDAPPARDPAPAGPRPRRAPGRADPGRVR